MQPTIAQMRLALNQRPNTYDIQQIGVNEAPDMSPKPYLPPTNDWEDNDGVPPGGLATQSGLPVGGVDMSVDQPGHQMMTAQSQQPMGAPPGQPGQPGQPQATAPQLQGQANPLGQPPSKILQMTPQGQAMSAMKPPGPPGMAKGGQPKKPLHYAPSPALMKSEIEAHAERMSRQMAGLENPNKKSLQQLAREQNLPLKIRQGAPKQDVPILNFEELKGGYSVGVPGDPSRGGLVPESSAKKRMGMETPKAGEYLQSVGKEKMESPVPMYGGKDYGGYGHWAFHLLFANRL